MLAARLDTLAGSVEIKGKIGDRPWLVKLPLEKAAEGKGLSKLWARRKISDAEIASTLRQIKPEDADQAILGLALEHQLVTRLTSLIAVDKTPVRPAGEPLNLSELPINLPAGWDFARVFGEHTQPAQAPKERRADADKDPSLQRMAAMNALAVVQPANNVMLPKTATDAEWKMMIGSILLMLGIVIHLFGRCRNHSY